MRFTKQFIVEQKQKLEKAKQKIEERLSQFAAKSSRTRGGFKSLYPNLGWKEDENAAEVAMYQDRLGVEADLEADLAKIKSALGKITKGTYGTCDSCGLSIPEARLKVFPEATTCTKCGKKG